MPKSASTKTAAAKTAAPSKAAAPKRKKKADEAADAGPQPWAITGELALNCSCDVFCPCVVSLGKHPPTYGYCQAWIGVRIDEGHYGDTRLDGQALAMMLDIPGKMASGNWTAALYVDDDASDAEATAMETIMTGSAGGTTGVLRLLVGAYLGMKRAPVSYVTDGDVRTVQAGSAILGSIQPIKGSDAGEPVQLVNSSYWMGPTVTIARGLKSRVRDFGRVWNFQDCSAELVPLRWSGP